MDMRCGASFKIWVWSTRTTRHQKKRYIILLVVESLRVPCVLYGHRVDLSLVIELETCITTIAATAKAGSDAVAGSGKLCWHDVCLFRYGAGNQKIRRVKDPGSSTVQRVHWGHAALVLQGVHGVVDESVGEKG